MVKQFLNKNFISVVCAAAAVFVLGGAVWAYIALRLAGGNFIILHFNDVNGITNVGGLGLIVFMGAFGLLVAGMNFAIARELAPRNRFLGRFLASMTLLFGILLFIAFAAIINVNV